MSKPSKMTRQTNRQADRERKPDHNKRDAASTELRFTNSRGNIYEHQRERAERQVIMNRQYMNDLYERSSI